MLRELQSLERRPGITLGRLVTAWTVAQPDITHALVGARNAEQARENAKAGDVKLTDDELRLIDEAIARHAPGIRV